MSATDSKKAKKRKSRKTTKSASTNIATSHLGQMSQTNANSEQVELAALQKLMDAEDDLDSPVSPMSRGANLGGERCLLCRCERPDPPPPRIPDNKEIEEEGKPSSLSQIPLWVCPDCRKTVEDEERRVQSDAALYDSDLRLEPPNLFSDMTGGESVPGTQCTCEACTERRQIEAEHEKETHELQQCWIELRHVVRCVYREAGTGLSQTDDTETTALPDVNKMKELVHRLCTRDPHQLYQRLESQGREYVIEMKVRLLKQLSSGHKTPPQARQFVAMLLEEFSNLCVAANTLSSLLAELESEHLKQFQLSWEIHNKHLFQSIIYSDPVVQNALPMLITQLRLGAASKEAYHEETYPSTLHRYLKFDDEMADISVKWRESHQLLEKYNEEQAALKAKQRMLKEDWEFFKAQRKLLEQKVLKQKGGTVGSTQTNSHTFELQFTETMRHIFQGTKPTLEECHCPNCNRKRCPCDECTISHMITCGIISPELTENMPQHNPLAFHGDPSPYIIDVTPPSMSSTSSSSGSSSPITIHPERLELPFEDCPENFEMADDEIPEEIEGDSQSGDSEDEDEDDEEEDDEEEEEEESGDEEENEEDKQENLLEASAEEMENSMLGLSSLGNQVDTSGLALASMAAGLNPAGLVDPTNPPQPCDCTHCLQAKLDQSSNIVVEEPAAASQCQCHACLQQSGQGVVTSLPQQLPATPRPSALHLYPHIHGSNTLHPSLHHPSAAAAHMRPLLQPHLYELHNPVRGNKPLAQPVKKQNFSLDLDTHEALNEHIYHAFGEWDNAYDSSKLMLSAHKYGGGLGSELFNTPPPLLMNGNPFDAYSRVPDTYSPAVSVDGSVLANSAKTSTGAAASSLPPSVSSATVLQHGNSATKSSSNHGNISTTSSVPASSSQEHVHTDACFKNFKPINRTLLNAQQSPTRGKATPPVSSMAASSSGMVFSSVPASTTGVLTTSHSDQCMKHNPFLHTHHSSFNQPHSASPLSSGMTPHSPLKLNPDLLHSTNLGVKDEQGRLVGNNALGPLNLPHTCNHSSTAHHHNNSAAAAGASQLAGQARNFQTPGLLDHSQPGGPPNASAMNNVSVGTSTVCNDPECEGHHDDEPYDDSCSEQSSSTSTSNQKDGKYCDCCYCEFFGHSNPPMAPTSRNYAEMRDRLRLRLKKKNEMKTEHKGPEPVLTPQQQEVLDNRGLEDLIRFINGDGQEEVKDANNKPLSAKAAKRARQKQRKLEEAARRQAEREAERKRLHEEQRMREAEQQRLEEARQKQLEQQHQQSQKRKKGKHKEDKNALNGKIEPSQNGVKVPASVTHAKNINNNNTPIDVAVKNQKNQKIQPRPDIIAHTYQMPNCKNASINGTVKTRPETQVVPARPDANNGSPRPDKGKRGKQQQPATSHKVAETKTIAKGGPPLQLPVQHQPRNSNPKPIGLAGNAVNKTTPQVAKPAQSVQASSAVNQHHPRAELQTHCSNMSQKLPLQLHPQNMQQQQHQPQQTKKKNGKKPALSQPANDHSLSQMVNHVHCMGSQMQLGAHPINMADIPRPNPIGHCPKVRMPEINHMVNGNHPGEKVGTPEKRATKQPSPRETDKGKPDERSPKNNEQTPGSGGRGKKKRKNKTVEDLDEIFMPKEVDPESGDLDEFEREIEEFKRFCMDSTPKREKVQVNVNIKDIFSKKKSGVSCA